MSSVLLSLKVVLIVSLPVRHLLPAEDFKRVVACQVCRDFHPSAQHITVGPRAHGLQETNIQNSGNGRQRAFNKKREANTEAAATCSAHISAVSLDSWSLAKELKKKEKDGIAYFQRLTPNWRHVKLSSGL